MRGARGRLALGTSTGCGSWRGAGAGRIFEFVHGSEDGPPVITPANLPPIVQMLQESIRDEPHIAEKVRLQQAYRSLTLIL